MPRRRNDPAGMPDAPNLVTDPVRERDLMAETARRFAYLRKSYVLEKRLGLDRKGFNQALVKFQRAQRSPSGNDEPLSRLNPWLELGINMKARVLAGLEEGTPLGPEHGRFVRQAAKELAHSAKPMRGAPMCMGPGQTNR